jgi:hypothetical protein
LIDVIGKTGRNWPIRDGKDQIKLIVNSVKSAGNAPADAQPTTTSRSRDNSTNVTRDPHASLSLFAPRAKNLSETLPVVAAPRASAKPPPRDYHDLFVGNESDNSPSTAGGINIAGDGMGSRKVAQVYDSPNRPAGIAPKGGAGKNYAPSRLFDHHTEEDEVDSPKRPSPDKNHSAEHFYKPNAKKYQHFDFADGSDPQDTPAPTPLKDVVKSKHGSQWKFDDFSTPAKHIPTKGLRTNDTRHWGNSDDEVVDSPIKVKKVDKPRKDNEPHFEFKDDGIPEGTRIIGRPRGAGGNTGMGLYKNNLYDDEQGGEAGGSEQKKVATIANTKDRRKDFDPHFEMTDDAPPTEPVAPIGEDRAKAVKMMDSNWGSYDQSPTQKENVPMPTSPTTIAKGINIAGDGMGSRKVALSENTNRSGPKGINIGGDGMGGKKGAGREWGFGDDSEEEAKKPVYRTGKTQGKNLATGGDFWDF